MSSGNFEDHSKKSRASPFLSAITMPIASLKMKVTVFSSRKEANSACSKAVEGEKKAESRIAIFS